MAATNSPSLITRSANRIVPALPLVGSKVAAHHRRGKSSGPAASMSKKTGVTGIPATAAIAAAAVVTSDTTSTPNGVAIESSDRDLELPIPAAGDTGIIAASSDAKTEMNGQVHKETKPLVVTNGLKNSINVASANFVPTSQQHDSPGSFNLNANYNPSGNSRSAMHAPRPRLPPFDPHFHHYSHRNPNGMQYAFHENDAPSPGPHGAPYPPPGIHPGAPMANGHCGAANGANSYRQLPPGGPQNGGEFGGPTDGFGRPMYPPDMYKGYTAYGPPSTPHSFHDSQSSGHGEEFQQFPRHPMEGPPHMGEMPPGLGYGGPGIPHHMGPPLPMGHSNHPSSGDLSMPRTLPLAFLEHIKRQFTSEQYADCVLEIRVGSGQQPMTFPAHRLILSQSEPLQLAMTNMLPPQLPRTSLPRVVLNSTSKYLRVDAVTCGLQYLYQFGLFPIPDPGPTVNVVEKLSFSLGYSATGQLLGFTDMERQGAQMACQLLSWETIEYVLGYILGDQSASRAFINEHAQPESLQILIRTLVHFLISNFPVDFELDASVSDPADYRRMPMSLPPGILSQHSVPKSSTSTTSATSPTSGTATLTISDSKRVSILRHNKPEKRLSNVSHIQFGDFGSQDNVAASWNRANYPEYFKVLSRVLLNLPFTLLKEVLETNMQDGVPGWRNSTIRSRVAKQIIDAREERRKSLLSAILNSKVSSEKKQILPRLIQYDGQRGNQWDVLCWREFLEEEEESSRVRCWWKWEAVDERSVPEEIREILRKGNGRFGVVP